MSDVLQFLTIALIFFFLGRYSRYSKKDRVEETIDSIVERAQKYRANKPQAGDLTFKTEEERERERNGDKALEEHWLKSGLARLVKGEK